MNKSKKIISVLAALAMALPTFTLAACGEKEYAGDTITYTAASNADVKGNGGFAVETKDYVYFINGQEANTASNSYGDVVKGALMRITKADIAAGNYAEAKIVVPSLFVTGNFDSGIYIYGDYVYYATPTTDKDNAGEVKNSYLDFKRAKLDGTEAPMGGKNDYFFRLSSNTTKYRFVQEGDTVYCLYEEDSKLKSYNTSTGVTTVLVSGASAFFYDVNNLASGDVYYTMSVTPAIDKDNSKAADYNQIYRVNAATTATVDASKASYVAKDQAGNTVASYAFDKSFMEKKNKEAKDKDADPVYDFEDYTTYPYVNLGKLVLDGVGSYGNVSGDNRFNADAASIEKADEPSGYTYTIQNQQNGGLYFTRNAVTKTSNTETAKLYYLNTAETKNTWNTITANAAAAEDTVSEEDGKIDVVSDNTTNASATAIYEYSKTEGHSYLYLSNSMLYKHTAAEGDFVMVQSLSDATLWKTEGDYLYYYGAGTNGKSLSRINYKGEKAKYNEFYSETYATEYSPVTLPLVDWTDSWYKPEFVTDAEGKATAVLYPNAQSFGTGSTAYNYIYLTKLGTNAEITARADKIDEVNEYIEEGTTKAQSVMKYYFRTGKLDAYTAVESLYSSAQAKEVTDFVALFGEGKSFEGALEKDFIAAVSRLNDADKEAIDEAWVDSLEKETETEDEGESLPTWALVLIIVGSALVAGAIVLTAILIVKKKEREKAKAAEEIVTAYKRKKIDTTDDKSIDVYADEEPVKEETEVVPVENEETEEVPSEREEAPVEE